MVVDSNYSVHLSCSSLSLFATVLVRKVQGIAVETVQVFYQELPMLLLLLLRLMMQVQVLKQKSC